MSRLTEKKYGGIVSAHREQENIQCSNFCNNCSQGTGNCHYVKEMVEKLAHYEVLEEQGELIKEEDVLKFYYIDSEDKYVVGQRVDPMYYAEVTESFSLAFYMSRYLPWGEHVVDEKSAWKEHTYCSEPREIPFGEWLQGFIEQREAKLAELEEGGSDV